MGGVLKAMLADWARGGGPGGAIVGGYQLGQSIQTRRMAAKLQQQQLQQKLAELGFRQQKHADLFPLEQQKTVNAVDRLALDRQRYDEAPRREFRKRSIQLAKDPTALQLLGEGRTALTDIDVGQSEREHKRAVKKAAGTSFARERVRTQEKGVRREAEHQGAGGKPNRKLPKGVAPIPPDPGKVSAADAALLSSANQQWKDASGKVRSAISGMSLNTMNLQQKESQATFLTEQADSIINSVPYRLRPNVGIPGPIRQQLYVKYRQEAINMGMSPEEADANAKEFVGIVEGAPAE